MRLCTIIVPAFFLSGCATHDMFGNLRWEAVIANLLLAAFLLVLTLIAIGRFVEQAAFKARLKEAIKNRAHVKGTARWGDPKPHLERKPESLFIGGDHANRSVYYSGNQHLVTLAPTRTGKGTCHIVPNLLAYPGSVIVNDIKGENFALTQQQRTSFGRVVRFAPFDSTTDSFNPLSFVRTGQPEAFDDALLIADMLIVPADGPRSDESYWEMTAKAFLAGLVLYVAEGEPAPGNTPTTPERRNLARVRDLLTKPPEEFSAFLELMASSDNRHIARAANVMRQKADKEMSGVLATAQSHTALLDSDLVARATSTSSFHFSDLQQGVVSLYLIIPPERLNTYKGLVRLMLGLSIAAMTMRPPTKGALPVTFFIDEFPSLRFMQPILDGLAYLAGYNCRLWLFAQDLGQLRDVYGAKTTSILANCAMRSFFGVNDIETADLISQMAGTTTIETMTETASPMPFYLIFLGWGTASVSLQTEARPLLYPAEVMQFRPDWQLVFLPAHLPLSLRKVPYFVEKKEQASP